ARTPQTRNRPDRRWLGRLAGEISSSSCEHGQGDRTEPRARRGSVAGTKTRPVSRALITDCIRILILNRRERGGDDASGRTWRRSAGDRPRTGTPLIPQPPPGGPFYVSDIAT